MQFKNTIATLASIVGLAAAQSLTDVLTANSASLSTLSTVLQGQPDIVAALSKAQNITILAPSNAAFTKFLALPGNANISSQTDLVAALLQYHVISAGVLKSTDFTDKAAFVSTLLTNTTYTNVTGGQVVEGIAKDGGVSIFSGGRAESKVSTADVTFDGGVVHVIDTVLTIPASISDTAAAANLTQLAGALTKANLVDTVDGLTDATVFAPNNAAFEKIASTVAGLSVEDLTSILTYHVVAGTVGYSSDLTSGDIKTVNGATVKVEVSDSGVKVNDANVVLADVLVANGVVHVIDAVLIPAAGNATSSSSSAAGSGTSATATATGGSAGPPSSTFTGAATRPTGAIAAAVLLGAGAMAAGAM